MGDKNRNIELATISKNDPGRLKTRIVEPEKKKLKKRSRRKRRERDLIKEFE